MTQVVRSLVNWRRLLLAAPMLVAAAFGVHYLTNRAGIGDTPRAALAETPPGVTDDIGVRKGQLARDFVGVAPDGSSVRLSDLRGRPTIINFWATWCPSCLAELPDFKRVQEELGAENLNVVAVNAGESSGDVQGFLEDLDAPAFHVAMDPTLVLSDAYGVSGMPTSLFLDADGVIRAIYVGQLNKDLMREYVAASSSGTTTGEPPPEIRLITTVARDHILYVDDLGNGRVELSSKSLRCDDSHCAESAIEEFAENAGVQVVEQFVADDPPRVVVRFDEGVLDAEDVALLLKAALDARGDPLYERPIEIIAK